MSRIASSSAPDPDSRWHLVFSAVDSANLRALVPEPFSSASVDVAGQKRLGGDPAGVWQRLISAVRPGHPKGKPQPKTAALDVIDVPQVSSAGWRELNALAPFTGPVAVTGFRSQLYCLWPNGAFRLFDPASGQWMSRAHAPASFVLEYRLALLRDQLHVIGFAPSRDGARPIHLCYDPASDRWAELEPMPTPRLAFAVATNGGALIVAGGHLRAVLNTDGAVRNIATHFRVFVELGTLIRVDIALDFASHHHTMRTDVA